VTLIRFKVATQHGNVESRITAESRPARLLLVSLDSAEPRGVVRLRSVAVSVFESLRLYVPLLAASESALLSAQPLAAVESELPSCPPLSAFSFSLPSLRLHADLP
jgi:hypothetical protein